MAMGTAHFQGSGPVRHTNNHHHHLGRSGERGFTLIEVLVVVAIIALLIAILLPSLSEAKVQARVVVCQANSKQIAGLTATYQTGNNGYVPVVFNYAASTVYNTPARACWLSVALRSQLRVSLDAKGGKYDPEAVWSSAVKKDYEKTRMPAFYACPFERDGGKEWEVIGKAGPYHSAQWGGRFESYQTWLWEDIVSGTPSVHGETWPTTPNPDKNGVPKYTVFSWNHVKSSGVFPNGDPIIPPGDLPAGSAITDASKNTPRAWQLTDLRRMRVGSLSAVTVAYCAQGEHMELGYYRNNIGQHRRNGKGGTNAIFADGHVEWVLGTRIGWP
jgi:prepilin-type N-terminal cleavage/methylation domain-containing protein/prepilin-type processing-associated H-X9-DG protein